MSEIGDFAARKFLSILSTQFKELKCEDMRFITTIKSSKLVHLSTHISKGSNPPQQL
jgi:hypothetical protein